MLTPSAIRDAKRKAEPYERLDSSGKVMSIKRKA
jgi:hypothetical protein